MALAAGHSADSLAQELFELDFKRIVDKGVPPRQAQISNLFSRRALARGEALREWIGELASAPNRVKTFGELDSRLTVIAADLVHRRMVQATRPRDALTGVRWPLDMMRAVLDTSMNALDGLEAKAFSERTITIPTGEVPTLQFDLSAVHKRLLWQSGYDAAKVFFASAPTGRNIYGVSPPLQALPHSTRVAAATDRA